MSDSEDESRDRKLKVVIIGDGSSGKVSRLKLIKALLTKLEYFLASVLNKFGNKSLEHLCNNLLARLS